MGTMEIDIDLIAGTRTRGRQNTFATNFMPLPESGSEFSMKWSDLIDSQRAEGIRDPIVVYESCSASTCRRATSAFPSCVTWGSQRSRRRSSAWCLCLPIPKPTASTRSSCVSTAWLPSTVSSFPRRARMRSSPRSRGTRSMNLAGRRRARPA